MAAPRIGFSLEKCSSLLKSNKWLFTLNGKYKLARDGDKPSVAPFHTAASLCKKQGNVKYENLPQPELKPIGPQDYERWKYFLKLQKQKPAELGEASPSQLNVTKVILENVNQQIETRSHGRLFAVVQIQSKQFKITTEDIIIVQGHFHPSPGDVIRLEKVLMIGSSDFTLIGRPLLNKDMIYIEATVIEKTLSQIITHFKMIRRQNHQRTHFYRTPYTMLRINAIDFRGAVNERGEVEGLKDRIINIS